MTRRIFPCSAIPNNLVFLRSIHNRSSGFKQLNAAFRRALVSLSHPISIAAIVILLLNDHIWRRVAPSWLTGKIGDFAWLIFAPFLLAALLAWLLPKRAELVGRGSIIGVGVIFALAKTVPAFHALTINVLAALTSWPNAWRMDPTDLIALPALLVAWQIWQQSATRSIRLPNRGWVLLPIAALAMMADSPAPDPGIVCLNQAGSQIVVATVYDHYASNDGGLTWREEATRADSCDVKKTPWELSDAADSQIRYRFVPGVSIERSDDGGQTWRMEIGLAGEDARAAFIRLTERGWDSAAGPFGAVIDRSTGNVVVAMGHEGVLVRTPDAVWQWVAVDERNLKPDLSRFDNVVILLAGEMLYALALIALMAGTLVRRVSRPKWRDLMISIAISVAIIIDWFVLADMLNLVIGWPFYSAIHVVILLISLAFFVWSLYLLFKSPRRVQIRAVLEVFAWIGWVLAVTIFAPPNMATGYLAGISSLAAIAVAILAVPIALGQIVAMIQSNRQALWPTMLIALAAALLYLLPYVLWSQGGIPFYSTAMLYSLALAVATLIAGRRYLHRFIDQKSSEAGAAAAVT